MGTPSSAPASTWRVTGQNEQTTIQPGGQPVKGVQVYFTTGQGHSGSVFIPYNQYNPEYVREQIADAAAKLDAIGSLTSSS